MWFRDKVSASTVGGGVLTGEGKKKALAKHRQEIEQGNEKSEGRGLFIFATGS